MPVPDKFKPYSNASNRDSDSNDDDLPSSVVAPVKKRRNRKQIFNHIPLAPDQSSSGSGKDKDYIPKKARKDSDSSGDDDSSNFDSDDDMNDEALLNENQKEAMNDVLTNVPKKHYLCRDRIVSTSAGKYGRIQVTSSSTSKGKSAYDRVKQITLYTVCTCPYTYCIIPTYTYR